MYHRATIDFDFHIASFENRREFILRQYKLTPPEHINELIHVIPKLRRPYCEVILKKLRSQIISTEIQLSVTLRILAGGSYVDVMRSHCVAV